MVPLINEDRVVVYIILLIDDMVIEVDCFCTVSDFVEDEDK